MRLFLYAYAFFGLNAKNSKSISSIHSTVNCNDHVHEIKVKSKQIKTVNSVSAKEPLTERFGDSGYYAMIEFHFLTSFLLACS